MRLNLPILLNDSIKYLLILLLVTLPLTVNGNGLIVTVLFISLILALFVKKLEFKSFLIFLPTLIFLFLIFGHVYSEYKDTSLRIIIRSSSLLLFPLLFSIKGLKIERKSELYIFTGFAYSTFILCFVSLVDRLFFIISTDRPLALLFKYYNTGPDFVRFFTIHPSYLALFILFSIFFLLKNFFLQKRGAQIISIITISFLIISLIMTSSRIHLLSFNILIMIFSIIVFGFLQKQKILLGILLIICLALPFVLYHNVIDVRRKVDWIIQHELEKSERYYNGESRIPRLKVAMNIVAKKPISGYGTGDSDKELVDGYQNSGMNYAVEKAFNAHNQYLEYWLKIGIFPVLLLILHLFCGVLLTVKNRLYFYLVVFVPLILFGFVESFLLIQKGIIFYSFFTSFAYYRISNTKKIR